MARTGGGLRQAGLRGVVLASLATAALAGWARPAQAADPSDPSWLLEARAGVLRFDYEERDPLTNAFLDGEEGFVPSLTVAGELRVHRFFSRMTLRLAKGSVDYTGQAQASPSNPNPGAIDGLPVNSTSDATFLQGELEIGGFLDEGRRLALFGALGGRYWGRDIQGTTIVDRTGSPQLISGLSETYTWWDLELGARWTFLSLPRTTWDVDGRIGRTFAANISVDLSPFGGPSSLDMGLGSRTTWRAGTTLRQDVGSGDLFLVAAVWVEGYAFGHSDVNMTYGILEPDSSTVNVGIEVGLGARF